jgi:hypothetical protein
MIYVKTNLGRKMLKEHSPDLPKRFLFAFILCDGKRDHTEIIKIEQKAEFSEDDINKMLELKIIEPSIQEKTVPQLELDDETLMQQAIQAAAENNTEESDQEEDTSDRPTASESETFLKVSKIANDLSSKLGLMGFRLNLAIQRAGTCDDLRALIPQLEKAFGQSAIKDMADMLKK